MPGGFVCSGSMKGALDEAARQGDGGRDRPLRKLFTKEQRAFYAEHAPDGLALDDLSTLGPIFVLKVKFAPPELGRKVVAEMWLYPDDSRLLELSTKCAPGEAFQVSAETRAFLTERGVDMSGEQETKTRKALEFFAGHLGARRVTDQRRPTRRPTGWIVLTGALLAAVIGLAIWAVVLQSDQEDVNAASARPG